MTSYGCCFFFYNGSSYHSSIKCRFVECTTSSCAVDRLTLLTCKPLKLLQSCGLLACHTGVRRQVRHSRWTVMSSTNADVPSSFHFQDHGLNRALSAVQTWDTVLKSKRQSSRSVPPSVFQPSLMAKSYESWWIKQDPGNYRLKWASSIGWSGSDLKRRWAAPSSGGGSE